ncbi:hypothetical protein Dimus_023078, partial [Dionaea muscipula]
RLTGGVLLMRNKYYITIYRGKDFLPTSEEQAFAAGTLAEFYESQERWGREISTEERNKVIEAASRAKTVRQVNQIDHKFSIVSTLTLKFCLHEKRES